LLILGIVFLVLIVVCCGGIALVGFLTSRYVSNSVSQDPQVIRRTTREIAEIQIPDHLSPEMSMDMKVPFSDKRMMTGVAYRDKQDNSLLMLFSFAEDIPENSRQQFQTQMRESMRQRGRGGQENTGPRDIQEREVKVRGKPEIFTFTKSKDPQTGKQQIEVTGTFEGRKGNVVMFLFSGDAEKYGGEDVEKILQSIR
jgi:hypothetical protein